MGSHIIVLYTTRKVATDFPPATCFSIHKRDTGRGADVAVLLALLGGGIVEFSLSKSNMNSM